MKNINWIGIITDDLSQYQKGTMSPKAVKVKMPKTTKEIIYKALPFAIPSFVVIFLSVFIKTYVHKQVIVHPIFTLAGLFIGFAGVLLHELLHALVYPKEASIYIGIYPKSFAAVALVSYPIKKGRFILMSLLPVSLGIVPMLLFWLVPIDYIVMNSLLFGSSIMGLISPYPDFYHIYQVIRQTPNGCKIQFLGDEMYWIK